MKPLEFTVKNSADLIPPEHIPLWNGVATRCRLTVSETMIHVQIEPPPQVNPREKEIFTEAERIETVSHGKLTFGKNVIAWGNGQALSIQGKGYLFVKVLYEAAGMQLEITDLEEFVWKVDEKEKFKAVKPNTFTRFLHRLAEKLVIAKFPYRLLPTRSQERSNAEITGAKLCQTLMCPSIR